MSIPLDNHHELCHGDACGVWDCASLPENVGQYREGFVVETNPVGEPDGSVEIEWSDGTRSVFRPNRPSARQTWEDLVMRGNRCSDPMCLCSTVPEPLRDRYGEIIESIDPAASEVITETGEIIDRDTLRNYCEAGLGSTHRDGGWTQYNTDGTVTQYDKDGNVYTREN